MIIEMERLTLGGIRMYVSTQDHPCLF